VHTYRFSDGVWTLVIDEAKVVAPSLTAASAAAADAQLVPTGRLKIVACDANGPGSVTQLAKQHAMDTLAS